jgi:sodium/hydrogen antiporter
VEIGFAEALLLIGTLLAIAAGLSGWLRGTVLSISVLSLGTGIALALAGVVEIQPGDPGVIELVELALILTLFSDGLVVERELLRLHWSAPVRAIAVAMPITLVVIALAGKLLFPDLSWAEAFLLGAVLSPTDPVVTSTVVSARRLPERLRHALNLESGLNDGLALPFVLFFLVLASPETGAGGEGLELLGEAVMGAALGAALGAAGGKMLPRLPGAGITPRYEGLYALGICLTAFALSELTIGNGLVAAFVSGVALAAVEHEIPEAFVGFSENLSAIFQVVTFVAFGALVVATGYDASVWALAAFIPLVLLVARPVAILVAFARTDFPRPQRLFMAWFGPKGVASILFALFVLNSQAPDRSLAFDVAAFVILASIVAHGLTDTLGARWLERRLGGREAK